MSVNIDTNLEEPNITGIIEASQCRNPLLQVLLEVGHSVCRQHCDYNNTTGMGQVIDVPAVDCDFRHVSEWLGEGVPGLILYDL